MLPLIQQQDRIMLYNFKKTTNELRNVWYTQMSSGSHSLYHALKTHAMDFKFFHSVHDFLILSTAPVSLPLAIIGMQQCNASKAI